MSRVILALFVVLALVVLDGCVGGSLAQPFDRMKAAPITVYRLQNYEPPPQQSAAGTVPLPPQIMQWVQQGAAMLPPGLLPPGLLPGQPPATARSNVQRFHNFPVLGWMQLNDARQRTEVLDILGHESNFVSQHDQCLYAEFGFSIAQINAPPADVLVSLSCDQVQAQGFVWPYLINGIPTDTARRIAAVAQRAFSGG